MTCSTTNWTRDWTTDWTTTAPQHKHQPNQRTSRNTDRPTDPPTGEMTGPLIGATARKQKNTGQTPSIPRAALPSHHRPDQWPELVIYLTTKHTPTEPQTVATLGSFSGTPYHRQDRQYFNPNAIKKKGAVSRFFKSIAPQADSQWGTMLAYNSKLELAMNKYIFWKRIIFCKSPLHPIDQAPI